MGSNTFGKLFCLTSFGESHASAIGGVIDGCPAGLELDLGRIQLELDLRRPGQGDFSSPRFETDQIQILSGIFEGKTTGTPIAFLIPNKNQKPSDYDALKDIYRPSHADFVYEKKYGIRDYRGSGRASARETAVRVAAGALARQFLEQYGIKVLAWAKQIGPVQDLSSEIPLRAAVYASEIRAPFAESEQKMKQHLQRLKNEGDAAGGTVHCIIQGLPAGLGEPVFDKLNARLASAFMGINAAKGVLFGAGMDFASKAAGTMNDAWEVIDGQWKTKTNHSGGIQAGISNGMDVHADIIFKAPSSIQKGQLTATKNGKQDVLSIKGRHDPCVVPRAVPVVEAMALLAIADFFLLQSKQSRSASV